MALTGNQLLVGLSRFIGDYWAGTTTSAGNSGGTTITDTSLRRFGDDTLRDFFIRPTGATNQYEIRRIVSNASATGIVTVAPAFTAQTSSAQAYEIHRYDPAEKFTALDEARLRVVDVLARTIYDDTTTADGMTSVFPVPSTMRQGPLTVQQERPSWGTVVEWNFLTNSRGESTTGYTASSTTAAIVSRSNADPLIPKSEESCTQLTTAATTAATYSQLIASAANGLTAVKAADRVMTYARWVYCTEASKVRVGITDDSGTTYGSYHGGGGWELLVVTDTVTGGNVTLLSAVIAIASTANISVIYVERGWWYYGTAERVRDGIYAEAIPKRVRRDDTTQQAYLDWKPVRGTQLRFVGREPLTALGTTASTQATNTMEVDDENAQILYAEAARILFARMGLNLSEFATVAANIAVATELRKRMGSLWAQTVTRIGLKSPWVA